MLSPSPQRYIFAIKLIESKVYNGGNYQEKLTRPHSVLVSFYRNRFIEKKIVVSMEISKYHIVSPIAKCPLTITNNVTWPNTLVEMTGHDTCPAIIEHYRFKFETNRL